MKRNKIVFFDIDGTLIDCNSGITTPTEKTIESIQLLRKKGYYIAIATGRPKRFLSKGILDIKPDVLIASNGSYIEIEDKEKKNLFIEKDILIEFEEICSYNNIPYILEGQESCVYKNMSKKQLKEFNIRCHLDDKQIIEQKEKIESYKCNNIVVFLNCENAYDVIKRAFGLRYNLLKHTGFDSYDLYSNGFSKGSGVKDTLKYLNIKKENSIAFGDDLNDLEMFKEVGTGIAMGKCNDLLLEYAKDKTDTVLNEGIYKKILEMTLRSE